MPPKPTCKVVKREGQKGARIAPKGCVVRTEEDREGVKVRKNKAGMVKLTKRVDTDEVAFRLMVAADAEFPQSAMEDNGRVMTYFDKQSYAEDHSMIYDTGAQMTLMHVNFLKRLSIPGIEERIRLKRYTTNTLQGVTGSDDAKIFDKTTFHVLVSQNPDRWEKVVDDIWVKEGAERDTSNLLGVTAIRQLSFLKVKFLNANEAFV